MSNGGARQGRKSKGESRMPMMATDMCVDKVREVVLLLVFRDAVDGLLVAKMVTLLRRIAIRISNTKRWVWKRKIE